MNIIWVSSEVFPYAKTGGLADVSASLPKALASRGHRVSLIMPYYPQQMKELTKGLSVKHEMLGVPFGPREEWARILEDRISENLSVYFIEFNRYFDRPRLYDWEGVEYSDNGERYIFFARAVMQSILALKLSPDIIHCNDWHTGLVNVYLKSHLYENFANFADTASVMTIHNIGYQGVYDKSNLYWTGLNWDYFNYLCLEFYDQLNFLKGGIMTADMVSTVSSKYAEEIMSPEFGFNLDSSLRHVALEGKVRGIVNGIDMDEWNPETDKFITAKYSVDNIEGKKACKRELQKDMGLEIDEDIPLFGVVSRFAYQKGLDILAKALEYILPFDKVQFAVLGSGEQWLEEWFSSISEKYSGKMSVYIGYSNELSHKIEAGSDFFVMPSRYEPCGLNQMYSMRYGTLSLVRATGGLDDTVENYDAENSDISTGFKFYNLDHDALIHTIQWAAETYNQSRDDISRMIYKGMKKDFSWNHTAELYETLYEDAHRQL